MTTWDWLVPFAGREYSGPFTQNFVCRHDRVYVMDNHRAALWCWHDAIDLRAPHSILHVDRHTDALGSNLNTWLNHLPDFERGIGAYLDATYKTSVGPCAVVRWDNYLSLHLCRSSTAVRQLLMCTHNDGDAPVHDCIRHGQLWDLPKNLSYWLDRDAGPWIVNIDLDYFFCPADENAEGVAEIGHVQMVSDAYIALVFDTIAPRLAEGRVGVVTVCLTPTDFTCGWSETEAMASRALARLGLDFALPKASTRES